LAATHRLGDAQPGDAVDLRAVPAVLNGDLVAEESRRAGAGMGNERLVLNCLDKFVQPVQVNIGHDRRYDVALRAVPDYAQRRPA